MCACWASHNFLSPHFLICIGFHHACSLSQQAPKLLLCKDVTLRKATEHALMLRSLITRALLDDVEYLCVSFTSSKCLVVPHEFAGSPEVPWCSFWTMLIRKVVACMIHTNLRMSQRTRHIFFSEGSSGHGRNAVH